MKFFKSFAVSAAYLIALSGAVDSNGTVVTTPAGNDNAATSSPAMTTAPSQQGSPNGPTSSVTTGASSNGTQTGTTPLPAGDVAACPTGWCLDYQFNPGNNTCITPDPVKLMDCWEDYCAEEEPGGYCLVWEPDSGRVCHGGLKKCYCPDYQTKTMKYYPPSQMPDGWSAAQQCVYEGATGTTKAPAPPPVVPASNGVRTAISIAGGAALGTLVIGNVF